MPENGHFGHFIFTVFILWLFRWRADGYKGGSQHFIADIVGRSNRNTDTFVPFFFFVFVLTAPLDQVKCYNIAYSICITHTWIKLVNNRHDRGWLLPGWTSATALTSFPRTKKHGRNTSLVHFCLLQTIIYRKQNSKSIHFSQLSKSKWGTMLYGECDLYGSHIAHCVGIPCSSGDICLLVHSS